MKRRRFLELTGLLALPKVLLASNRRTPSQAEGPFYPIQPISLQSDLLRNAKAVKGRPMWLRGSVTNVQGVPLSGIKIEIWQCDGKGLYDHPLQPHTEQFDPDFIGHGAVLTDRAGDFSFRTLYPVPYTGRPPHIHVKLWDKQETLLTTQLYLQGQTGRGSSSIRTALQISPKLDAEGQLTSEFTFIV